MTPKHLCIFLLALVAVGKAAGQSEDIPIENDNQFPLDKPVEPEGALIEGSGDGTGEGTIEEPATDIESTPTPALEEVQAPVLTNTIVDALPEPEPDQSCPSPCVCHIEGGTNDFVVDCSGYDLTEVPSPLDPKTTVLNLQKNKITEIPREISALKSLKVLNAADNSITDIVSGSVSELPELTVLKLSNNRLIEYPKDLKNGFSLIKLQELDLGGNDMRTVLEPQTFSVFISLQKLTLATSTEELVQNICITLKDSLETVCTGTCEDQTYECPDAPEDIEDELIDAPTLPGLIEHPEDENADPVVTPGTEDINVNTEDTIQENVASDLIATEASPTVASDGTSVANGIAVRTSIVNAPEEAVQTKSNSIIDNSKDEDKEAAPEVKTGATTSDQKTGGVDKSVIGIIVAGMVLVVAGITIKKNWSSIRKRFSSSSRTPERAGANANGNAPEEVPLKEQDKSPV